jgi:hypothetical protein
MLDTFSGLLGLPSLFSLAFFALVSFACLVWLGICFALHRVTLAGFLMLTCFALACFTLDCFTLACLAYLLALFHFPC